MTAVDARELVSTIVDLLDQIGQAVETMSEPEDIALILSDLREVRVGASLISADVEAALLAKMGDGPQLEVPGLGVVEAKRRIKRTAWNHDDLVKVVVARALDERRVDPDTGEYEREADAVARAIRECVSFSGGKITGLKARNIQVDEFCQEEFNGWSVKLPTRDTAGGSGVQRKSELLAKGEAA